MFLKKLVSVISALTIAVSTFAGLTLTASAAFISQYKVEFKLADGTILKTENDVTQETYDKYTSNDYVLTVNEKQYTFVKSSFTPTGVEPSGEDYYLKYDAVITVREAQQYTVTLAAYESNIFLGSIGTVSVWETAEEYSYSYPAYVVHNNKLYKKEANSNGNYTESVKEKVSGNIAVNVAYTAAPVPETATAITLLEPDGETVDGASKGGASKTVEYDLHGQGDYTVIARYKGYVTAKCGETIVGEGDLAPSPNDWKEVETTFSNKNTESNTAFAVIAADDSYIDYVILIRTGDAHGKLIYNKSGDGTGTVKVGSTELKENEGFSAVVGSSQTIIVSAGENSYIKSISGVNGVDWGTNETTRTATITMPSVDATLNVEFGKLYNISVGNITGGVVTSSAQTAKEGQKITVVAAADSGYVFGNMSYTYIDSNKEKYTENITGNEFTMPAADVTINVSFNKLRTVSLARAVINSSGTGDGINPGTVTGETTVSAPDAVVPITANTARGYRFVKFIYVSTPADGSIDELSYYTTEDFNNKYGSADSFTPTESEPEKGMYGKVTGELKVPDHDVTVIAVYEELEPIAIDETNVTGGTLKPTVSEVYPGDTFGVNVAANDGYYEPTSITVKYNNDELVAVDGIYTVPYPQKGAEYPGEITLSADFEAIPYNDVATVVSNVSTTDYGKLGNDCGNIALSGTGNDGKAYKDAVITVSATPKDGYEFVAIKVTNTDGSEEVTTNEAGNNSVTFTMPDYAVKVTAEFKWTDRLPEDVLAVQEGEDYTEDEEQGAIAASLWTGELKGLGLAYKPYVSVTVNHNNAEVTKTAIAGTTISGGSNIFIAVVVDKKSADVKSIKLSGLSENTQQSANQEFDEYNDSEQKEEV